MQLLIASGNRHKLEEMRQLLDGLEIDVIGPSDLGLNIDVAETGATYAENALLKAKAYAAASGLAVLADDSGLKWTRSAALLEYTRRALAERVDGCRPGPTASFEATRYTG